jgi:CRISPR-associated protein Cmx8
MPDSPVANDVADRIFRLARTYVLTRTERKCGIAWSDIKDRFITDPATNKSRRDVPMKYREARESVTTQAFLRIRACHSREDFIAYFTGTLCSVPQYLPPEEFVQVSKALLDADRWEDVKSLTMLALSGLSHV